MCGICGGEVHVTGDGDLICQGFCGETLTREEIDNSFAFPAHPQPEEYDDYEDDCVDEWNDGNI